MSMQPAAEMPSRSSTKSSGVPNSPSAPNQTSKMRAALSSAIHARPPAGSNAMPVGSLLYGLSDGSVLDVLFTTPVFEWYQMFAPVKSVAISSTSESQVTSSPVSGRYV